MNNTDKQVCDSCSHSSSYRRKDCTGRMHRACVDHSSKLEQRVRDANDKAFDVSNVD